MTSREENIVNISMMAARLIQDGKIAPEHYGGHAELTSSILYLANQFEELYGHIDYNAQVLSGQPIPDYWEDIDNFASQSLLELYPAQEDPVKLQLQSSIRIPQQNIDLLHEVLTQPTQVLLEKYGLLIGQKLCCFLSFEDGCLAEYHVSVPDPGRQAEPWLSLYDENGKLLMENDAVSYGMNSLEDSFTLETDAILYEGKIESLEKVYTKSVQYSELALPQDIVQKMNSMLGMSGSEIYAKYGLKRDENICNTLVFDNDYSLDVRLVICEEDPPYIDLILYDDNGCEIASEVGDIYNILSPVELETEDTVYCGQIKLEERSIENDTNRSFGFVSPDSSSKAPLQVKVILNEGIVEGVLKDQETPVEVEVVDVNKDYDDYEQLRDYRAALYEDKSFRSCDYTTANFETEEVPESPDLDKNTMIRYLYRDAENNKMFSACVLQGILTDDQKSEILACRHEGEFFIPGKVGLPERRFDTYDPEIDHPWFELWDDCFEELSVSPTVSVTASELVKAFSKCKDNWEQDLFSLKSESLAEKIQAAFHRQSQQLSSPDIGDRQSSR